MSRAVCLIVNPRAGGGHAARRLPRVVAALEGHGLAPRVELTRSLDHARALARGTLATGEVAATLGGDGLAGAVAGELRGTPGVLAVLPGGRGNDFARRLGIDRDPGRAAAVLVHGREARLDVAEVAGRTFLGIASAGFDSDVQEAVAAARLPLGRLVYLHGTLRALASWRPARFEVAVDGRTRRFIGYAVAVANSGLYGGGMRLAPAARLDDGELDVVLTAHMPRRRFLARLPRLYRGSHVRLAEVSVLRGREVAMAADRDFAVWADGDPVAALPATARVVPGALRALVPA